MRKLSIVLVLAQVFSCCAYMGRVPAKCSMNMARESTPRQSHVADRRGWLQGFGLGLAGAGLLTGLSLDGAVAAETAVPKSGTKVVSKFKIKETPAGIKYVDVVKGDGASPQDGDYVIINYLGYLSDGKVFDGEHGKGRKPLAFRYGAKQVFSFLEEALVGMQAGGERQCFVPADLGFGDKGVCVDTDGGQKECLVPPGTPIKIDVYLKRVAPSPI